MARLSGAGMTVRPAQGWNDITADLDHDAPWTLAREDGLGALQFSTAIFNSGAAPEVSIEDLAAMLAERWQRFGAPRRSGSFREGALLDDALPG